MLAETFRARDSFCHPYTELKTPILPVALNVLFCQMFLALLQAKRKKWALEAYLCSYQFWSWWVYKKIWQLWFILFGWMPLTRAVAVPLELPNTSGSSTLPCHTFQILLEPGFSLTNITHSDVFQLLNLSMQGVQMWDQHGQVSSVFSDYSL